jgi:uncharacterized lipoprotein YmbA
LLAWLMGAAMLLLGGCASDQPAAPTQQVAETYNGRLIPVNEPVETPSSIAEPLQTGGTVVQSYPSDMQNYTRVQNAGAVPFSGAPPDAQLANSALDQSERQTGFSK